MSTSFLEKFKGKTQQVGKAGLIGLIQGGQGQTKVTIQTNIQFKPPNQSYQRQNQPRYGATNSSKNNQSKEKPQNSIYANQNNTKASKMKFKQQQPIKPVQQPNPFLIMNPFCLDDQQPGEPFNPPPPKKPTITATTPTHTEKQYSESSFREPAKKSTIRGNSTDSKGWSKLGGLGANIGGDDWQEKRKKIDKMQISGFTASKHQTMRKLQSIVERQADIDVNEINCILDSLRYRIGANGRERVNTLNEYFKQIVNISFPALHRYMMWTASEGKHLFNPESKEEQLWFKELFDNLGLSQEQKKEIVSKRAEFSQQKDVLLSLIDDLDSTKKKIEIKSADLQDQVDVIRNILNPVQCAKFIIFIERNKYRKELNIWDKQSSMKKELKKEIKKEQDKKEC